MRSILRSAILAAATFSLSALAEFNPKTNTDGQNPNDIDGGLALNAATDLGCFSSPGKMFDMGIYTFQTPGWCQPLCVRLSKNYFALLNGTNCFCGDAPPDNSFKVDSSSCDEPCAGYNKTNCGGINFWDVQKANMKNGDPTGTYVITIPAPTWTYMGAAASTSSSVTGPATVVVTQSASPATNTQTAAPASGPNTAAIAAGVVVAIVLVCAIAGGLFFFMRRRKQQALLEEQRRHEMMTNFVTAEKPGSGYTSPDARLDPSLMFQRRLSDGSIRDNEDYSRRILKVANPDD